MRFLHDGQLTGARSKIPVQLSRRPLEAPQSEVQKMYDAMLTTLSATAVGRGRAEILSPREAWPGNPTAQDFIVVQWLAQPPENPPTPPPPSPPATARPRRNEVEAGSRGADQGASRSHFPSLEGSGVGPPRQASRFKPSPDRCVF